ncbi:MAG TPA: molybdopterin-dependent oxidoreductase, partial [Aestuariivirga sp.]|nr:molybdopterin-dependent oxidoreductase [Aestuariivirga sp.]
MNVRARILETDTVGLALAHDSAALHVQGTATYIDDMREPEGTLHVEPGYAPNDARGKVTSLNLGAVRAFPGVVAVLTAKDIPGVNDCSPGPGDDPIFAEGEIEFHGQVIFAVVAETREIARRAARLAKIEVAAMTPAVTVEDALAMATRDVVPEYAFTYGDVKKALKAAPHVISESFHVGGQEHFYIEGQVALAMP